MTSSTLFIKRSIKSAAAIAKAGLRLCPARPSSVNIFAYHRVVADIAKAELDAIYGIVISTTTFRRHCELMRPTYDVVSLTEAADFLAGKRNSERPIAAITFDDGYRDFYDEAFPVLHDLGLKATVFLPTAYIGQEKVLAHDRIYWLVKTMLEKSVPVADPLRQSGVFDKTVAMLPKLDHLLKLTDLLVYLPNAQRERVIYEMERKLGEKFEPYPAEYTLLDWNMVGEMAGKGIDFGSHTENHVVLPLEDKSVMQSEIGASKTEIDRQLGKKALAFAYPNGEYSAEIKAMTAAAGYTIAVTTETRLNHPGADLLSLGRTSLCEESTRGLMGSYSSGVAHLRLGI